MYVECSYINSLAEEGICSLFLRLFNDAFWTQMLRSVEYYGKIIMNGD
jgi:hypothetical protein